MAPTAMCRLLFAGACIAMLPACFTTKPPRVTQATVQATAGRDVRPQPPVNRLPYAYGSVIPHRDFAKSTETVAKRIEKVPPPEPLPIESTKDATVPVLDTRPIAQKVADVAAHSIVVEPPKTMATAAITDPPLVVALRYCYDKRVNDALESLKSFDPVNQEALLTLLPITVRMAEGSLNKADPEEVAIIVEQLQALVTTLQPRAALKLEKLGFCKSIRKFGVFEPLEGKPSFRAGDMVEIYGELRNISCERGRTGEFRTRTSSTLEIREAGGNSGWRKEVPKVDHSQTAPHDLYHHYRFQLPELAPGPYVMSIEVVDIPTGRKVRQKLEFRVMP